MMRGVFYALALLISGILYAAPAPAQNTPFSALARVLPQESAIKDARQGAEIKLILSQGVPFRVFTLDAPHRLVLDFQEVDWTGLETERFNQSEQITSVHFGGYVPGWSRMVLGLTAPLAIDTAAMELDEITAEAVLKVALVTSSEAAFAEDAGAPRDARWDLPEPEPIALPAPSDADAPLLVMLDPGHGGLDPGAETENGHAEKDLMLRFAYELGELMVRSGNFEVLLTREGDYFVSLERRIAMAQQAKADLFISLHADALAEGLAHGATIYTLSEEASDLASAKLAERHNRSDLLSGSDLTSADDEVADVLLDLARQETQPRSQSLARSVVEGMQAQGTKMYRRPLQSAGFSVLKSADIPSILIEVGFLSSPKDYARIIDPEWREHTQRGILRGVEAWRDQDAAQRSLVRQ